MASWIASCTLHEEKRTPPIYAQQPAVADDAIWALVFLEWTSTYMLPSGKKTSQPHWIWYLYIGPACLCADDVGGLLGLSSQTQTFNSRFYKPTPISQVRLVGLARIRPICVFLSRVSESAVGKAFRTCTFYYLFFFLISSYFICTPFPTLARIATLLNNNERSKDDTPRSYYTYIRMWPWTHMYIRFESSWISIWISLWVRDKQG